MRTNGRQFLSCSSQKLVLRENAFDVQTDLAWSTTFSFDNENDRTKTAAALTAAAAVAVAAVAATIAAVAASAMLPLL